MALKVLRNPYWQSRQLLIHEILEVTHTVIAQTDLRINFCWAPGYAGIKGNKEVYNLAQQATTEGKQAPPTVCLKTVMLY